MLSGWAEEPYHCASCGGNSGLRVALIYFPDETRGRCTECGSYTYIDTYVGHSFTREGAVALFHEAERQLLESGRD